MKVHLISFCAGYEDNDALIERARRQIVSCEYINSYQIVNPRDDSLFDKFVYRFSDFLNKNLRGYGYWIWKPFIICEYLKKIPENDVLVYADIGCEFSSAGGKIFSDYLLHLRKNDFLVFSTYNGQSESVWTKKELIDLFDLSQNRLMEEQVAATFFLLKNNVRTRKIMHEWLNIAESENFIYINDVCSKSKNPEFIEHRHDQSIFSMLMKKYNIRILRESTYHDPILYYKNSYIYRFPIHALRSKDGKAMINENHLINIKFSLFDVLKFHLIFFAHRVFQKIKRTFFVWF
jgi:hypothetical protein